MVMNKLKKLNSKYVMGRGNESKDRSNCGNWMCRIIRYEDVIQI